MSYVMYACMPYISKIVDVRLYFSVRMAGLCLFSSAVAAAMSTLYAIRHTYDLWYIIYNLWFMAMMASG